MEVENELCESYLDGEMDQRKDWFYDTYDPICTKDLNKFSEGAFKVNPLACFQVNPMSGSLRVAAHKLQVPLEHY